MPMTGRKLRVWAAEGGQRVASHWNGLRSQDLGPQKAVPSAGDLEWQIASSTAGRVPTEGETTRRGHAAVMGSGSEDSRHSIPMRSTSPISATRPARRSQPTLCMPRKLDRQPSRPTPASCAQTDRGGSVSQESLYSRWASRVKVPAHGTSGVAMMTRERHGAHRRKPVKWSGSVTDRASPTSGVGESARTPNERYAC